MLFRSRDIAQETGIKTIPMENKCKKVKWLSEEALQIAVNRREKQSQTLFFWAPKSLQMVIAAMKLKDAYSLEGGL